MKKTIDGIPVDQVQHLFIIEEDTVLQHKESPFHSKKEFILQWGHCGYSTETAATLDLIKQLEKKIIRLDAERAILVDKLFKAKQSECINVKTHVEKTKPEKIGNIRI